MSWTGSSTSANAFEYHFNPLQKKTVITCVLKLRVSLLTSTCANTITKNVQVLMSIVWPHEHHSQIYEPQRAPHLKNKKCHSQVCVQTPIIIAT